MRILFLLIFLAGLAAAASPYIAGQLTPTDIGSFRVYAPASGFRAVSVPLKATDAPVRVALDLAAPAPFAPEGRLSSATVTAAKDGRTVLATPVFFEDAAMRDDNPQTPEREFRASAGTIEAVEDGTYTFTVGRGEAEIPQVTAFDLVLFRAPALDARIQPVGFALVAVGFIGFMLAAFRRVPTAAAEPAKPRWGRAAGEP